MILTSDSIDSDNFLAGATSGYSRLLSGGGGGSGELLQLGIQGLGSVSDANGKIQLTNHYQDTVILEITFSKSNVISTKLCFNESV